MRKIKSVVHDFGTGSGPSTSTTLGFSHDGIDVLIGTFYEGPYMQNGVCEYMEKVEAIIDEIVAAVNHSRKSNSSTAEDSSVVRREG